mmetsp:Transcript_12881/g.14788  ORF Transcript_12881/g.14788 Transcript_12881/m.14788 type:complete len:81 (-) Transcript_12881:106-348(-)
MSSGNKFAGIGWNPNKICGDEQKKVLPNSKYMEKIINNEKKYNKDCDIVVNNINELRILQKSTFPESVAFLAAMTHWRRL